MSKSMILLLCGITLLLSGCSLFKEKPRDVNIVTTQLNVCTTPPKADKIITRNVDFKIIRDEFGIYWIAVTPKYYENLSINMKEIIQHIKQKNAIIKYYKSCLDDQIKPKPEEKSDNNAGK